MTQAEKQLLLVDLSARLPYGVIIHLVEPNEDEELYCLNIPQEGLYTRSKEHHNISSLCPIEQAKPYLRPMSSMTEEERKVYNNMQCVYGVTSISRHGEMTDWLNAHHFDYRGLISMGVAIEASEGMYNLKEE